MASSIKRKALAMERGPLLEILHAMVGTDKELSIIFWGEDNPLEIRNVEFAERLTSSQGILLKTKANQIWIDSSHVSAAWQVRDDI
ncbi:MAG: hypothetical protein ACI9JK_000343 [Phycisphaerales bacterium]